MRLPDLRALEDLPADVQSDEEGDVDVCRKESSIRMPLEKKSKGRERTGREEAGGIEVPEDCIAVDEDEEDRPEDAPV